MAVIGNRIRQVLRILHTDGPCTAREVFERGDGSKEPHESAKYLQRAVVLGLARRSEDKPVVFTISQQGSELVDEVERIKGVRKRQPSRRFASGPSSVWDYAARQ